MEQENQKRKDDEQGQNTMRYYLISTGFFGGLFASAIAYLAHFLNFIPFGPGVIWQNTPLHLVFPYLRGPWGHVLGIIFVSLLSIPVAYLYYSLFRRMNSVWTGVFFGLALWAVLFLGLNQIIRGAKNVIELGWTTNLTFICILIFYGLFIGYSISYEFHDRIAHDT